MKFKKANSYLGYFMSVYKKYHILAWVTVKS